MNLEWIAAPALPARAARMHKGEAGHVLIVGGSCGLSGAPRLAAGGALVVGSGLVTAAVPDAIRGEVAGEDPAIMVRGIPCTIQGQVAWRAAPALLEFLGDDKVCVLGPGLGRHPETAALVRRLHGDVRGPLVIDADGLAALEHEPPEAGGPRVYTPHPGEAGRLLGLTSEEVQEDREAAAAELQSRLGGVVVLKGFRTLIADGERLHANRTGNPGLATGGSGDILAGMIGGLWAQRHTPTEAACAAVYLHGAAADALRRDVGERAMMPLDLLNALAPVIASHERPPPPPREGRGRGGRRPDGPARGRAPSS